MTRKTRGAVQPPGNQKYLKNLTNLVLISRKPLAPIQGLQLQNLLVLRDLPPDLVLDQGPSRVHHLVPDLDQDLDQSIDTGDHTADQDQEVEAGGTVLVLGHELLTHKDVDTQEAGEMDTMTEDVVIIAPIADLQCLVVAGLVGAE